MSADFDEMPNSTRDDEEQGANRPFMASTQIQRNVASESKPQEAEKENIVKKEQPEEEQSNRARDEAIARDESIAHSVATARNLPVVTSRPTQGLQRLEMDQNIGA